MPWMTPICAICTGGDKPRIVLVQEGKGVRHWPYEGHVKVPPAAVREVKPLITRRSVTQPVTKTCNTCGKRVTGRGKVCNACRQRAYRERAK